MSVDSNSSLKERIEQTFVNLLIANDALADLVPRKQNAEDKPQRPYITVTANVGKQMVPGSSVRETRVAIELLSDSKQANQSAEAIDGVATAIQSVLTDAQDTYGASMGLVFNSDTSQIEGETGKKRVIECTVWAS